MFLEVREMNTKADATDFLGRFREIISDPLNLLIKRHPFAGTVDDDFVYLHNGNKVPLTGPYSYYGDFSDILVINRGVHEPLEEYVFQELLNILPISRISGGTGRDKYTDGTIQLSTKSL